MGINNNRYQKNANTALVTRTIWNRPGISRVEIADQLGLYRSTVTNIINALIDSRVVYEGEVKLQNDRGGRRPVGLQLNSRFGCVLGIDVQPSRYHVVMLDMVGNVLHTHSGTFHGNDVTKAVAKAVHSVASQLERSGRPLLAICLGIPGVVDSAHGIIVKSLPLETYNLHLAEELSSVVDLPVFLDNDANCHAWFELGKHRREALENFLCVFGVYNQDNKGIHHYHNFGIGLGLAINNRVFSGHNWSAGEFVTNSWRTGNEGQSGLPLDLVAHIAQNPIGYRLFIKDFFSSLVSIVTALDPQVCFIQGEPFAGYTGFSSVLEEEVPQFVPALERIGCQLTIEQYDPHVVAKGAAMMYLQKLFSVPELSGNISTSMVLWDEVIGQASR